MKGEIIFKKSKNKEKEKGIIQVEIEYDIYNSIQKMGKQVYNDSRRIDGLIKAYALVAMESKKGRQAGGWTPIKSSKFEILVSKRHYKEYVEILQQNGYIDCKRFSLRKGINRSGVEMDITQYRLGICVNLFSENKTRPITFNCNKNSWCAYKKEYEHISTHYSKEGMDNKRKWVMSTKEKDVITTQMICELVRKIYCGKIKRQDTIHKNIETISNLYSKISYDEIYDLVFKLLEVIRISNKEQYIKHNCNQVIEDVPITKKISTKFYYYKDVGVDIKILEECYCLKDLKHITRLSNIPQYHYDGKLYSAFTNLRKPLREYVCYKGCGLVEVSDISCAHFAMLPKIFERVDISTPFWEMCEWKKLTQNGDLYGEVARFGSTTRDLIKPTFQPFFSIKNERSFIYAGKENDGQNRATICEFFKERFPFIYQALLSWHKHTNGTTIKSVANVVESEIINSICDRLRDAGLHPFRVNDAIYLPSNEVSKVDFDIKQEVFNYINRTTEPMQDFA